MYPLPCLLYCHQCAMARSNMKRIYQNMKKYIDRNTKRIYYVLEQQRGTKQAEENNRKRKHLLDGLGVFTVEKRRKINEDIQAMIGTAYRMPMRAEKEANLLSVSRSNSLRQTVKLK